MDYSINAASPGPVTGLFVEGHWVKEKQTGIERKRERTFELLLADLHLSPILFPLSLSPELCPLNDYEATSYSCKISVKLSMLIMINAPQDIEKITLSLCRRMHL